MLLSDTQRRFKETILNHPDVIANPPEDLADVFDAGDIPLSERLNVYRNNVVGSLTDVMVATFPALDRLVGRDFMEGMARSFILENPPTQGCLNTYGHGFAKFAEGFEPAKSLPYLPDVIRLELAMNDAYYAKDDEALSPEALAGVAPENLGDLILYFRDSVHLLQSSFPVAAIRDTALSDDEDAQLNLDDGQAFLMVYRPQLDTQIIILDEAEFEMLSTLESGFPLGEAVEQVLNTYSDFDFQAFLQKHLFLETFLALPSNT